MKKQQYNIQSKLITQISFTMLESTSVAHANELTGSEQE
jgi:hypothetical protein